MFRGYSFLVLSAIFLVCTIGSQARNFLSGFEQRASNRRRLQGPSRFQVGIQENDRRGELNWRGGYEPSLYLRPSYTDNFGGLQGTDLRQRDSVNPRSGRNIVQSNSHTERSFLATSSRSPPLLGSEVSRTEGRSPPYTNGRESRNRASRHGSDNGKDPGNFSGFHQRSENGQPLQNEQTDAAVEFGGAASIPRVTASIDALSTGDGYISGPAAGIGSASNARPPRNPRRDPAGGPNGNDRSSSTAAARGQGLPGTPELNVYRGHAGATRESGVGQHAIADLVSPRILPEVFQFWSPETLVFSYSCM